MNWSEGGPSATKGVYVQSEGEHMSDPDNMPSYESQCKQLT